MEHLKAGVYAIENLANGKYYIGSAVSIRKRFVLHKCTLQGNKHHSARLQNAWNKYGEELFAFYRLETVEQAEDLVKREQVWISEFRSADPQFGYNISPTAKSCLGVLRTQEYKARLAGFMKKYYKDQAARTKVSEGLNKHYAEHPAARTKLSEAAKKRFADPAERVKVSETLKKRLKDPGAKIKQSEAGKKYYKDPAHGAKVSDFMKKRWGDPAFRMQVSEAHKKAWVKRRATAPASQGVAS